MVLKALTAIARLAIALERRNTGGTVASVAVLQDEGSVVLAVTPAEIANGAPSQVCSSGAPALPQLHLWPPHCGLLCCIQA